MTLGITFEQALAHSWERLTLMLKARRRDRAGETLRLAQLIVAGWSDKHAWQRLQQQLLNEIDDSQSQI